MVTLNRDLLYLPLTECSNISSQEVFEQNSIFLEVASSHESGIHDDVIGLVVVAEHTHEVLVHVLLVNFYACFLLLLGVKILLQLTKLFNVV